MTDGRGLAFLNKIQALHCEGFHCKGSSAFIDSQNRYAAKWGKALGRADHSLPLQDSFAYTHSRKLGKIRKTCPGRVREISTTCPLGPQLSYVEQWPSGHAGDQAWCDQKNKVFWDRRSEFGTLPLHWSITFRVRDKRWRILIGNVLGDFLTPNFLIKKIHWYR